jgi:type IV secretion system protein TrbE
MLRLDRVMRPWKEAGALNSQINLYGFWNEQAFLTKSGDLGIVLRVGGVDYESLDQAAQEYAVKRLEAALKTFGVGFHIYQYLFKTNRPDIPFHEYQDPVIQAVVDQRKSTFARSLIACLTSRSSMRSSSRVRVHRQALRQPSCAYRTTRRAACKN